MVSRGILPINVCRDGKTLIRRSLTRTAPSPAPRGGRKSWPLPQIQRLEEVVPLVVDDDEGGEILDLDAPHGFHAELWIFERLDLADAILREPGRRAADRAEIKAAMGLASPGHP